MKFHIYSSNQREKQFNTLYDREFEISKDNISSLIQAFSNDYVCARYKNNSRKIDNFMYSDCLAMDIDNDHSDNTDDWITPEKISVFFYDVQFAVHYSRNNMKEKNGKSPRPKFHALFPINIVDNASEYAEMKRKIYNMLPYFDRNALDAGRFFYGTANPEVQFFDGFMTIDKFINNHPAQKQQLNIIPQGRRNNTMHDIACKLLTKYGNISNAYNLFIEHSRLCQPPLPDDELQKIWSGAAKFYNQRVVTDENYIPPEIFNLKSSLKPDDYSDIGQAKILAREYKDKLRYCNTGTFLIYNQGCWHENDIKAQGFVQELTDRQLDEVHFIMNIIDTEMQSNGTKTILDNAKQSCIDNLLQTQHKSSLEKFKQVSDYKNFIMRHRNMPYIKSTLEAVKTMIAVEPDELDKNEFDLNTPAGTYDLRLGLQGRRAHNPDDLITKITAVAPDDTGMAIWLNFLNTIFQDDKTLIDFVQDTIGLAAIGKVYCENIIIAYGKGNNGKSTFYNVIANVLNNYSGTIASDSLVEGYRGNSKAERAEMKGKRIIIASELEEGKRLNTATLKQLCSTDKVHAEKKFKAPFDFTPTHSLVLCTNYKPEITANDLGTWRRIIIIPFKAQIEKTALIKNYSDYLLKNAGGAILKWIIAGAYNIINKNFQLTPPDVILSEINDYKDENDWFSEFIEHCCELAQDYSVSSKELYSSYRIYCQDNSLTTHSTNAFYLSLENLGCRRSKENKAGKRTSIYKGIKLKM